MRYLREIDSTNEELKRQICSHILSDDSIFTFLQHKGRGRNSRQFISENGGLYYSFAYDCDSVDLHLMPLVSVIVVDVLEKFFDINLGIKWVNDIIYNDKKCAGILVERCDKYMIIGIGINVYNDIPKSLQDKAIAIKTGEKIDTEVLFNLADKLDKKMHDIADYDNWLEIYKAKSTVLGKYCSLSVPDGKLIAQGRVADFFSDGSIVLETENGSEVFDSGELSLRVSL